MKRSFCRHLSPVVFVLAQVQCAIKNVGVFVPSPGENFPLATEASPSIAAVRPEPTAAATAGQTKCN